LTRESQEKCGAALMAGHREYYKREGGGFLLVQAVVNLVNPCMPMVCSCIESAPIMHKPTCCLICVGPYE